MSFERAASCQEHSIVQNTVLRAGLIPLVPNGQLSSAQEKPRLEDKYFPSARFSADLTVSPHVHIPHPVMLHMQRECAAFPLHLCSVFLLLLPSQMSTPPPPTANKFSSTYALLHLPTYSFAWSLFPYIPAPIREGSIKGEKTKTKKYHVYPGSLLKFEQGSGVWVKRAVRLLCQCGIFNKSIEQYLRS